MELKRYQADTLSVLRRFFEEARVAGPKNAYESITGEPEQAGRLRGYAGNYAPLKELPDVPCVCLRLPTGGGKTILAAHAVSLVRDAWIEKDHPLVLWLVPTKTIRQQTVEALKNTRHAYRKVLDDAFDGRVRIFDIADFVHMRPHDLRDCCCIVVGTIQTLRVTNTEGRKVYAHNEDMEPHFSALQQDVPSLETLENGGVKYSFANLLHVHRPLMLVDEAHKAVTGLTREMQARVNPSAIVEFTATPRVRSNILHSVSARELKNEEMLKLPIMLHEHDNWQNAVNSAVAARASLAATAGKDRAYIRPVVLFQAQPRNQEVTVEALKNHLVEVERIPERKIAVATGVQRELDGIDLFNPSCPIDHVITVEALKEGWDCSLAYVFCSVQRIQSATDVEQLLGRVMRMPYARRRQAAELNKAYAFLSEPTFGDAARGLADRLVEMGFEEDEAQDNIEQVRLPLDGSENLVDPPNEPAPKFTFAFTPTPEVLYALRETTDDRWKLRDCVAEGEVEIEISGWVDQGSEQAINALLPEQEREDFISAVARHRAEVRDQLSPAERGEGFTVPRLMSVIQGTMEFADADLFMEYHDWSLLDHSAKLDEHEFTVHETARRFEVDIDGNRVTYTFASEEEQLALDVEVEGWTPEALVNWLDRRVRQPDVHQIELLRWLHDMIDHLVITRGMNISALMRCKFLLATRIQQKIKTIRQMEQESVYQQYLLEPESDVLVSFDHVFTFEEGMYPGQRRYLGPWKPGKHFLGPDRVPAFDGADDGEEFQCAQVVDSIQDVEYWLRNVARHSKSFWLPTATDRFYPDFVALLKDGRLLVVEYKGAHIAEGSDTAEKRTIGALWEQESEGKCLFLVVEWEVDGLDMRGQLLRKISPV